MRFSTASLLWLWALSGGAVPAVAQVLEVDSVIAAVETTRTGPFVRALNATGALIYRQDDPLPAGLDFPALSLDVPFSAPGHLLSPDGMKVLRSVGLALSDPRISDSVFQVAAHVYIPRNQARAARLSQRRADIVAAHLVTFYGIEPNRLLPIGYGPTRPVDPAAPGQSTDTRIEFINVSDLQRTPTR